MKKITNYILNLVLLMLIFGCGHNIAHVDKGTRNFITYSITRWISFNRIKSTVK